MRISTWRNIGLCWLAICAGMPVILAGELDEYVAKPDASFQWKLLTNHTSEAGRVLSVDFQSQTWQGIPWKHGLRIYVPADLVYPDTALLFITGGGTDSKPKPTDDLFGFALAKATGCRVAVLPQVPNQPLLGGKKEDDLISETFLRYLETKDPQWPLLLPMVKSAVRAMDVVTALTKEEGQPVTKFVVTGASKRGWTTWLTGAVDPRVIAIAPMVIPTLNFHKQNPHQLEVWGKYSEQIDDYVSKGLMEKLETEDGKVLTRIVDPYFYIDRITVPKLQINGTNDRYWTLDSVNLYWDELKAPSYVLYLPNAGHGLEQNRQWAIAGVGALARHAASGRPMPEARWSHSDDPDGKLRLSVEVVKPPGFKSLTLWTVSAPTQDFREARWSPAGTVELGTENQAAIAVERPQSGWFALYGDMLYNVDGMDYHLSTQIRVVPPQAER
jgi:PhoPQ-activated pathogenicity-related protein